MPTAADWDEHFRDVPPAFHRLLADLMQEIQTEREHELGIERRGRRPALPTGNMQDVVDVIYPRRSDKPFPEALKDATKQTNATVAALAGMNPGNLHRMLHGREPLTKSKLEAIAKAIHVNPGYFHEYRVLAIHEALDALLTPHRSMQAYAAVEPQLHATPRPATPNSPNGYAMTKTKTFANRATKKAAA